MYISDIPSAGIRGCWGCTPWTCSLREYPLLQDVDRRTDFDITAIHPLPIFVHVHTVCTCSSIIIIHLVHAISSAPPARCTPNDLKYIIRLIKHDLRINAGPKHV